MNTLQRRYKIYTFTLTLSDKKTKKHETAHFEVHCHILTLLNGKNESVRLAIVASTVVRKFL